MTITGDSASMLQREKTLSHFCNTAANPMKCNVLLWNAQLFLYAQYWHSLDASLMQFPPFTSMKVCLPGKGCMLSSISKQICCGQSRRCRSQSSQFVRRCSWQLHSQHAYWHYTHITRAVILCLSQFKYPFSSSRIKVFLNIYGLFCKSVPCVSDPRIKALLGPVSAGVVIV